MIRPSHPKTMGRVVAPENRVSKAGRKRKKPPKDAAATIRKAAASGASQTGVALALGSNVDCLKRWFNEQPELLDAFNEGRELERAALHGVLQRMAAKGGHDGMIAAMFLLKSKHSYREGSDEAQANRVAITFALPGPMRLKDFMTIEEGKPDGTTSTERLPAAPIELARGA